MISLTELIRFCDTNLRPDEVKDYCPNGLQVEGKPEVRKIVGGVTACEALIDAAIDVGADAILVHHGYFWRGESEPIVGMKGRRIAKLLRHHISLIAYHLPLDLHPEWGNNAQLARRLGWLVDGQCGRDNLVFTATLDDAVSPAELASSLERGLERAPLLIESAMGARRVSRIGWCTGGAQGFIEDAARAGLEAFISGEISEQTVHAARELGVHYLAAGHHATERYGVQALGGALAAAFGVEFEFVDVPNPV